MSMLAEVIPGGWILEIWPAEVGSNIWRHSRAGAGMQGHVVGKGPSSLSNYTLH